MLIWQLVNARSRSTMPAAWQARSKRGWSSFSCYEHPLRGHTAHTVQQCCFTQPCFDIAGLQHPADFSTTRFINIPSRGGQSASDGNADDQAFSLNEPWGFINQAEFHKMVSLICRPESTKRVILLKTQV